MTALLKSNMQRVKVSIKEPALMYSNRCTYQKMHKCIDVYFNCLINVKMQFSTPEEKNDDVDRENK